MTSAPTDPARQLPGSARAAVSLLAVAAIGSIAVFGALSLPVGGPNTAAFVPAGEQVDLCRSIDAAYLSGRLHGAVDRVIEWRGTDMICEGGFRPDGDGVRLVFAAPGVQGGERLVFVLGISGPIDKLTEAERPANITLIDESSGRFFSAGRQDRCWTTVASVDGTGDGYRIDGEVYCTGSLPSLSDGSSISLRDFRYSGRLILDAS